MDPALVEFEISERALMNEPVLTQESLFALKDIGVRLAIDNFGSGPSSLGFLQQLPLDVLKMDRSFIADLDSSIEAQILCGIILTSAHRLSLDVVAVGVESEKQEAFLIRNDCLYAQGHHFSMPIGPDRVAAMMAERGTQAARKTRRAIRRRKAVAVG